jgi:rod shape-determining protein MreD
MPLFIFLLILLQIQWPRFLTPGNIKPHLLLILLFSETTATATPLYGAFWGLVIGSLLDVFSMGFLGFLALVYSLTGALWGGVRNWFYLKEPIIQIGSLGLVILVYEAIFFVTYHFLYLSETWYRGLYRVLLPEALYTFILGALFLWLKSKISPYMVFSEKKIRF